MSKLIGLSGPQGGGKSTLLNGLCRSVDEFKVARAVQTKLGWHTLDEVFTSPDTMMEFQSEILRAKYMREKENKLRDEPIILTERTFADIAVYTTIWCWELVDQRKWKMADAVAFSIPFIEDCVEFQKIYDGVIYLPYMDHMKFEADPHRAKEQHIDFFEEEIERFFRRMSRAAPVYRVKARETDNRIVEVNQWIETL